MLFASFLLFFLGIPQDVAADRSAILAGIERIEAVGIPGPVAVFGERAFPVLCNDQGESVVAAARFGDGRVVAFGHGSFLGQGSDPTDRGRLLRNAIAWAAAGRSEARIVDLNRAGSLSEVEVLTWGGGDIPEAVQSQVRNFVEKGGGLVIGQCPWGWQQLYPKQLLREHAPANRILAPMGLAYAPTMLAGPFPVAGSRPERGHALQALLDLSTSGQSKSFLALERALQAVPASNLEFLAKVEALLAEQNDLPMPTPDRPLRTKDALSRLYVSWWSRKWQDDAGQAVAAAPGADQFPGKVAAGAPRISRRVRFETSKAGWLSTGLYAAAGETVVVKVVAGGGSGWSLRIGPHTDSIAGKARWQRWPSISRRFELGSEFHQVASSFGGLIYFEAGPSAALPLELEVSGVVDAPFFNLADPDAITKWSSERKDPAPWAEIAGHHLILTLPSDSIRQLQQPEAVARYWDQVMQAHYRLAARALPERPERFVADVQISAGYMHAGYPIMTHLDVTQPSAGRPFGLVLDLERLQTQGSWGHFHELGHNCQRGAWTFAGTGEVTCNLFSLHAMEKVVGLNPWDVPWLEGQKKKAAAYLRAGAPFQEWKRRPGLALLMYAQLQKAFGWEPFTQVFAEYEALSRREQPRKDDDKRDQWMIRMSRAVERNLGPFFERWGVPVSDRARAKVAELKVWMPDFRELGLRRADGTE